MGIYQRLVKDLALWGACLISAGLVVAEYTPAPQTIGVALIFLHPFLNGQWKNIFRNLAAHRAALLFIAFFLLTAISYFYTGDKKEYWEDVFMKLPFLLIPLGMAGYTFSREMKLRTLFLSLIIPVFIAGTASFLNYLLNYEAIHEQISHSKPIPIVTGINHIYYSVFLAFSTCLLGYLIFVKPIRSRLWKSLAIFMLMLMILYLHTISARTGLACFYAALLVGSSWVIVRRKQMLIGTATAAIFVVTIILAVKYVPSLHERYLNTKEDLAKYTSGENINHYSISMRLAALKTAWKVFQRNPVTGVGPADLHQEMLDEYEAEGSLLLPENRKQPHNQFMQTAASLGILGFAILLLLFIYPFTRTFHESRLLMIIFLVLMFTAFQFESLLERQAGLTFFTGYYLALFNSLTGFTKYTFALRE